MSTTEHEPPVGPPEHTANDPWLATQRSPEFRELRRRLHRFVWPVTAFFLAWYFAYVLLAVFAPDFMSIKVSGNITVGLLIGFAQFATTFAIAVIYVSYANRNLDPTGGRIRADLEGSMR